MTDRTAQLIERLRQMLRVPVDAPAALKTLQHSLLVALHDWDAESRRSQCEHKKQEWGARSMKFANQAQAMATITLADDEGRELVCSAHGLVEESDEDVASRLAMEVL